jgi:WD40 repeat protein
LVAVGAVAVLASVGAVVGLLYNAELESVNNQLRSTSGQLEQALGEVQAEKGEAERQRVRAREEEAKARRYLYLAQMALAQRAEQEGRPGRVMQLLRSVIPESPEQADFRDFEWHLLWRKYHGEQSRLRGHTGAVTAVAFSPDDRLLASGSADRTIKLWDTATGKEVLSLRGHEKRVTCLAFSPDSKRLVSGGMDGAVKLWDTATGRELQSLEGHAEAVTAVAYSSDGRHVVSGSRDKTVRVWDADASRMTAGYQRHAPQPVSGVAFSPDGKTVASVPLSHVGLGGFTGEAVLWSASTGEEVLRLGGKRDWTSVAFSPDGKHLATGEILPGGRGEPPTAVLRLWDLDSPQTPLSLQGHTGPITCLVFSPNGKRLASSSLDQTVRIWDVLTGKETSVLPEEAGVLAVAISPDGRWIAAGSEDRTVKLWGPPGDEVLSLSPGGVINNVVFSPDGRRVAASSSNRALTVWDAGTGEELRKFAAGVYLRVAWSPDGRSLGVDGRGGFVDPLTGQSSRTLPISPNLYGTAFSPDGKLFATATGKHGNFCVWERGTGARLNAFSSGAGWSSCVAFSPDGKWLAAGSGEMLRSYPGGSLNVWDLRTSQRVFSFDDMGISVWGVAFSPDGKRLAAATGYYGTRDPGEVWVWDTTTGGVLYRLKGHADCVWSVAFSPDGRRLASAAGHRGSRSTLPGEVKIWDMNTGQEVYTLRGHARAVHGVAFSPCGRRLATASADGTVKIWDGTPLAETPRRDAGPAGE